MSETQATPKQLLEQSILEQRKVFLWGMVDDKTAKQVIDQILYLSAIDNKAPIHFHINSPGGITTSGFAIYDIMHNVSNAVYTYCLGFAASMGSILLAAGEEGHRYIYPTAEVMIHQPSMGGFQATYSDIEIHAQQIIKTKELTANILAKRCGQPFNKVMDDFDRDYWMNADEAIDYGIVDKIVA